VSSSLKWNEIVVESWQGFSDVLEPMLDAYTVPPTYVFRGQPDASWCLAPSLLRRMPGLTDRAYAHEIERLLESEFMAQASLFAEVRSVWPILLAMDRTERWAYMQHHSCPTRLLDWTTSAFVAAYFAVEQLSSKDGAIFVVAPEALKIRQQEDPLSDITDESFVDLDSPDRVVFTWPNLRSGRVVAQQGHFSVSTNILSTHDGPILEACSAIAAQQPKRIIYRKITIASHLKIVILQQLRAMNIAPHALFPNIDGLGKSLADLATLKVALYRPEQ
jgi:hypothetical protein